jgi:hypothetical protein
VCSRWNAELEGLVVFHGQGCIGCAPDQCESDKLTPGTFHHTDIPGKLGKDGHGVDVEMEAAWIGSRLGRRSVYCTVGPIDLFRGVGESNVIPLRSFDIDRKLPIFSDIPITHSVFFTQPQVLVRNDGEMKEIEGRQEI